MSSITANTVATDADARSTNWGRFALTGLATVAAATLANVLFYYAASAVVDYDSDFVVLATPGGTVFFTVLASIIAVLVYAGLLRFTRNPERNFKVVSAVVLAFSIIPDLTYIPTVEGSSNGQTAVLILMHVIAAIVIVGMLTTRTRADAR